MFFCWIFALISLFFLDDFFRVVILFPNLINGTAQSDKADVGSPIYSEIILVDIFPGL